MRHPEMKFPRGESLYPVRFNGQSLNAHFIDDDQKIIVTEAPMNPEQFWFTLMNDDLFLFDFCHEEEIGDEEGLVKKYYPDELGETKVFGSVQVTLTAIEQFCDDGDAVLTYTYILKDKNGEREINRLHCKGWKNEGEIDFFLLDAILGLAKDEFEMQARRPIFLCDVGIGRSAIASLGLILKNGMKDGSITKENFGTTLLNIIAVAKIRRGINFLPTFRHFELLCGYGQFLMGDLPSSGPVQTGCFPMDTDERQSSIFTISSERKRKRDSAED
jgi:hypothetical protein